ncbi:MAG: hypothetical protein D6707_04380, partial [Bacteroidetes bacterium]
MLRRFFFFGIGVALGVWLVYFFLIKNNPRDITGWLPNKRVLQMLSEDSLIIPNAVKCKLSCLQLSYEQIKKVLLSGEVDFNESSPRDTPKRYIVKDANQNKFEFLSYQDSTVLSKIFNLPENCNC